MKRTIAALALAAALVVATLTACANSMVDAIEPGMGKADVSRTLGPPVSRSFRESNEAWEYHGVVGMGVCRYTTIWMTNGVVTSMTQRTGRSSGPGCGPGSREVDWGQMPRIGIDIKQTITSK